MAIMRKPAFDGYPLMLASYMRVWSDSDRHSADLQCDALLAAGVDASKLVASASIDAVAPDLRKTPGSGNLRNA
jgi:hypothetical protein